MAEVKYFSGKIASFPATYFDTSDNVTKVIINSGKLNYSPIRQQYHFTQGTSYSSAVAPQGADTRPHVASNVFPLFYPESILPTQRGTADNQVVGNNYKWLNTMVDIEFTPAMFLNLLTASGASDINHYRINREDATSEIKTIESADPDVQQTYALARVQTKNWQQMDIGVNVNSAVHAISNPGNTTKAHITSYDVDVVDTYGGDLIDKAIITATTDESLLLNAELPSDQIQRINAETGALYAATNVYQSYVPITQLPSYKPYYYMRLVVLKLKMSQTDYTTFRKDPIQQFNLLNSIWWNRLDDRNPPVPHMSVRTNDLNVDNPFGGMFQFKYNKLIRINPFKEYKFRINLYSYNYKGDLITIKDKSAFVQQDPNYPYFSNGLYVAYLLGPTSLLDFDSITASFLSRTSIYTNDGYGSRNNNFVFGRGNPFEAPYTDPIPNANTTIAPPRVGTVLPLGTPTLSSRTAYLD